MQATIGRKKRLTPPVEPKVTGEVEARVIALACSTPPAGQARRSLRLLERQVALIDDIPDLDHSTIGRVILIWNQNHLQKILNSYVAHYNGGRPHRGLNLGIPAPPPDNFRDRDTDDSGVIGRTDILGGLIHEYHGAA